VKEFLWKYLVGPIVADSRNAEEAVWQGATAYTGYNPVNTFVYALTAATMLYLTYRFFKWKDVELDSGLAFHSIPFMFLGGSLRFIEDAQIISSPQNIILITPFVYLLIALMYIPAVIFLNEKKLSYLGHGLLFPVLAVASLGLSGFNTIYLLSVLALSVSLTGIYYWVLDEEYTSKALTAMAGSQLFEGSSSMMAAFYDYNPKQLLAQQFNSVLGPPGILVMKLLVLGLAVKVVTDIEDGKMEGLTFLVLYAIGFGTGFRVFLRALAGI
jgi:uncharacterized membrane protein